MTSILTRLRQCLCGLTKHNHVMRFDRARIGLECCNCGYRTAGWEVGK